LAVVGGRFGDVIGGVGGEGAQRHVGAALGERAAHDDRHGRVREAHALHGLDAVHVRHHHVEQHHVRIEQGELLQGTEAAAGLADHFDVWLALEDRDQYALHDYGIVDHEDFDHR